METITIPTSEYIDLINLYKKLSEKLERIKKYEKSNSVKKIDALKYCGTIQLKEDALEI